MENPPPPATPPPSPYEEPKFEGVDLFADMPKISLDEMGNPTMQPAEAGKDPVLPYVQGPVASDDPFARRPEKEARAHANKSWVVPAILLAVGWGAHLGYAIWVGGTGVVFTAQLAMVAVLGAEVVLSFIICLLGASIVGATIGNLGTAFLRVAAVTIFPTGICLFIPYLGPFVIQPLLFWFLLAWFFDLDLVEGFILSQLIWMGHFLVIWLLAMLGMTLMVG